MNYNEAKESGRVVLVCQISEACVQVQKTATVHFTERLDAQLRKLLLHLQTLLNPAMSGAFTFTVALGGWLFVAWAAI